MEIARNLYLQKLIDRKHNTMIKIVTGIRRCGKSYLLFRLFRGHLLESGVGDDHIIGIALDDRKNLPLRNPDALLDYIYSKVKDSKMHYILLDEIQYVEDFEGVLNSFLHHDNLDVYVTGSNSRFLSTDVITEFRGRGDEVHLFPLSFGEYLAAVGGDKRDAWRDYLTYGGLPMAASIKTHEGKAEYLQRLFKEVYLKDILERNRLYHSEEMQELLCVLASSVGSLCSPRKLADTFKSVKQVSLSPNTIATYGRYFENAFLLHRARRYDIKGRHYIDSPFKFYFEDIGLRNALLNFRQMEESHLMENIIYNELRLRGYSVDVGIVPVQAKQPDGKYSRARLEVDFVANQGSKRFYLQSAFRMYDDEKIEQENRPLRHIDDSFKKIVVAGDSGLLWRNNDGHVIMNIQDFLLNPDSLDL